MAWWRRISGLVTSAVEQVRLPGWARTLMGALTLVIVLGFFARRAGQTLDMVRQAWQPVSWLYLVLSFTLSVIGFLVMALVWYGVLHTMGGRLPLPTAIRLYGLTLLPRYVPGMVWGYAGRTLLCEREGVPRKVAAGSAVVEVGLIVGSGMIVATARYLPSGWIALVGFPGVSLLLGLLLSWSMRWRLWVARLARVAIWYGWVVAYIGFWLLYGASSWLVVLSVVPDIGLSSALDVIVSATVAWLAGFLVVLVPAGLGVREGVLALTLTPILGSAAGVFVPLMARVIGMLAEAAFAVLCALPFRGGSSPNNPKEVLPHRG